MSIGDPNFTIAQLPVSLGGLGLRSTLRHSCAAYISSFHNNRRLTSLLLHQEPLDHWFTDAVLQFNGLVEPAHHIDLRNLSDSLEQRSLSSHLDATIHANILNSIRADSGLEVVDRHLAVHNGYCADHAGSFLHAPPSDILAMHFSNPEWQVTLKRRLLLPILQSPIRCSKCGKEVDVFGDHCLLCGNGNDRITKHNKIQNQIVRDCQLALLAPQPIPDDFREFGVEPDVGIPNFSLDRPAFLDIACTNPQQMKYVHNAAQTILYSAKHYAESVKDPIYVPLAAKARFKFTFLCDGR
jgi:hypothetical protein